MIHKIKIWHVIVLVFLIFGIFANGTLSILLLINAVITLIWNIGELYIKRLN